MRVRWARARIGREVAVAHAARQAQPKRAVGGMVGTGEQLRHSVHASDKVRLGAPRARDARVARLGRANAAEIAAVSGLSTAYPSDSRPIRFLRHAS